MNATRQSPSPSTTASARWRLAARLGFAASLLAVAVLVWFDAREAWFNDRDARKVVFQLTVYWGCWLLWPAVAWKLHKLRQHLRQRAVGSAVVSVALLLAYGTGLWARFGEPMMLRVAHTELSTACGVRVALVSDLHMGIFWRRHDLERLVDKLNTLDVDAVLVAGDWTIEPPRDLERVMAPLAGLRHRVISVTGNHDEGLPGPPLTQALVKALAAAKVQSIEGQQVPLGRCELVGLGNESSGSAGRDLLRLNRQLSGVPPTQRVVLTHDPDTAGRLPPQFAAWVLAGHTHGGQVQLPYLTDRVLARVTEGAFRQGLYRLPHTQLFVTSGVGMSNLPFRLGVPPTIDVLSL